MGLKEDLNIEKGTKYNTACLSTHVARLYRKKERRKTNNSERRSEERNKVEGRKAKLKSEISRRLADHGH